MLPVHPDETLRVKRHGRVERRSGGARTLLRARGPARGAIRVTVRQCSLSLRQGPDAPPNCGSPRAGRRASPSLGYMAVRPTPRRARRASRRRRQKSTTSSSSTTKIISSSRLAPRAGLRALSFFFSLGLPHPLPRAQPVLQRSLAKSHSACLRASSVHFPESANYLVALRQFSARYLSIRHLGFFSEPGARG